jgi:hypothetical protein
MFKSNRLYLFLLAVPLAVGGCFEYDQDMTLHEDGSGTVSIHYNAPAQKEIEEDEEPAAWREKVPALPIAERAIIDSFGGVPLVVEGVSITTADDYPDVSYNVKFDDVEDLNGRGIFNFEDGKFAQAFSLREDKGVGTYAHVIDFDWPLEEESYYEYTLSTCVLTFQVKLPGEIVESNGTAGSDNTVGWEYTLADLLNQETKLWATYEVAETAPTAGATEEPGTRVMWVWGLVILGAFAAAPIVLVLLKRDKFLFMAAALKALEQGAVYKTAVGVSLIALAVCIITVGLVSYLSIWRAAIGMAGAWQRGGFVFAVILGIVIYMAAHATIQRAKSVLRLPESDRVIIPVASTVTKLAGELAACGAIAFAIFQGGVGFLLLKAGESKPLALAYNPESRLWDAVSAVVFGFAFLLISYVFAELVDIHGKLAKEAGTPKSGDPRLRVL